MPEQQRSVIAFEHYWEGEQRFEYFISGISTALCAYVGQTLQPQKFCHNPAYTLEVFSLALVVTSLIFGFKRIELGILLKSLNGHKLHLEETRGTLISSPEGFTDGISGYEWTPEAIGKEIEGIDKELPVVFKKLKTTQAKIGQYYDYRNVFLLLGFIGLFLSKILMPYLK